MSSLSQSTTNQDQQSLSKMPLVNLHVTSALLLLALSCPLWQIGQSLPVMSKGPIADSCVFHARTLLHNITGALSEKNLFSGIDCSQQGMELNTKTNTPSACAPKESTCSGITKSEFDQESCLKNIVDDLHHYYKFLTAQPDPKGLLGPAVLLSLREFMEKCFTWNPLTDLASEQAAADRPSTYDERLSLCKVLKGFQVRTVTINRVIGYMRSGDHTK